MNFDNIELAASGWAGVQWYNRHQFADGITDEDALCYLVEATPTRVHELIQIVKRQKVAHDNLVIEVAAEKQRADMLLEQAQHAAAAVQAEQQRYEKLAQELAAAKAAIPALTQPLPKWIDDQKGSGPNTDALIEYIEQMRGDLPVQQPAVCLHRETVEQSLGDGTPIEFCPECGTNRLISDTWPVQQPAPVDGTDSIELCVSDIKNSIIFDTPRDQVTCVKAVTARLYAIMNAAPVAAPVAKRAKQYDIEAMRKALRPFAQFAFELRGNPPTDTIASFELGKLTVAEIRAADEALQPIAATVPAASVQPETDKRPDFGRDGYGRLTAEWRSANNKICIGFDGKGNMTWAVYADNTSLEYGSAVVDEAATFTVRQPDSGRDAALVEVLKPFADVADLYPSPNTSDVHSVLYYDIPENKRIRLGHCRAAKAYLAAHPANVAQPVSDAALLAAIRNGVPLEEPVSVAGAMMAQMKASVCFDKGLGPLAMVQLVNIQVQPWTHTKETATAYADGFNRGVEWLRSSIIEYVDRLPPSNVAQPVSNAALVEVLKPFAAVADLYPSSNTSDEHSVLYYDLPEKAKIRLGHCRAAKAYLAANVGQVREDQSITQRDAYHDVADNLANAIAAHFGVDIGEHSSANCPWTEALRVIEEAPPAGELSDAKIIEVWNLLWSYHGHEPCKIGHIEFARAILAAAKKGPTT